MQRIDSSYWTYDKLVRLTQVELTTLIANLNKSKRNSKKNTFAISAAIRRAQFVLYAVGNLLRKPAQVVKYSAITAQAIGGNARNSVFSEESWDNYYQGLLAVVQANKYLAQLSLTKNAAQLQSVLGQVQHNNPALTAQKMLSALNTVAANSNFAIAA